MTGARGRGRPTRIGSGPDNRELIVVAARELFAQQGFEKTTMRAIGTRAGVDPALIHHYFQNKERLTVEALRPDVDAASIFAGLTAADDIGAEFIRRVLHTWEADHARLESGIALVRIAMTHNGIAEALRRFQFGMVESALGEIMSGEDRDRRIALIVSQVLGMAIMRYVLHQPDISSASVDDLAAMLGPGVDHLIAGC